MFRLEPFINIRWGSYRVGLGPHFLKQKVEVWGGRFCIVLPWVVFTRGYI